MKGAGLSILGVGCVTAHGRDWGGVWEKIRAGKKPAAEFLQGPGCPAPVEVYKTAVPDIPPSAVARLRRSGSISYFACAAAADAVQQAGPLPAGRTALIFAATDGAVTYTRRFFEEVAARGAGSPLLFPETVYNAPASHVAAMLGLDGVVLTLVNDASAGMDTLSTASDLIHSGEADRCLVVAAEELDWISCEGYRRWKIAASGTGSNNRAVLTEGAVAMVLGPPSPAHVRIARVHPGRSLRRHSDFRQTVRRVFEELSGGENVDLAVMSSVVAESIEESLVRECFPDARLLLPKQSAGEAFAVSSLLQCLCAWQELQQGGSAIIPVLGWSGQVGGAFLTAL
ncbi:MAG: beta-ketoacyl synthase N-terminal-like domain-containing protein [Verrucomicrobiota bacterium]